MKPQGRIRNVKGCGNWKVDQHPRTNGRKVRMWYEGIVDEVPRGHLNQLVRKEVNIEISELYPNHFDTQYFERKAFEFHVNNPESDMCPYHNHCHCG